jgi:hypothetical protein
VSRTHKEREQVWAVVRFDGDVDDPAHAFTVKEIVRDQQLAEAEAARLNALNADKGCRYWATPTRLFPDGSAAGPSDR